MVRLPPAALALAALLTAAAASAQAPVPLPPRPAPVSPGPVPLAVQPPEGGYPPPGDAPPGYAPPGYAPPGYAPPEYAYGYAPPPPPPPPPPPNPLRWSLRYDPFDLIERRVTLEGEVAVYKFFALEIVPTYIFGSPYSGVTGKGFALAGRAVFYLSGEAFRGFWLKAHVGYESYSATFTNPLDATDVTQPQQLGSAILGVLFGDTWVIPRDGGFALSGGIGIAFATAKTVTLTTNGDGVTGAPPAQTTLYDGFDKVRLLGSVGLGVAF
jgi:hypothetical protein